MIYLKSHIMNSISIFKCMTRTKKNAKKNHLVLEEYNNQSAVMCYAFYSFPLNIKSILSLKTNAFKLRLKARMASFTFVVPMRKTKNKSTYQLR